MKAINTLFLACTAGAAFQVAAQDLQSVGVVMPMVEREMARQCAVGREQLATNVEGFQKEQAYSIVKISCDCMPDELERVEADLSGGNPDAMITQEAFLSRMHSALSKCTAKLARTELGARCLQEDETSLGVENKTAYCACVSQGVDALDDATLVNASTTALQNFKHKQTARALGTPESSATPTAIDEIKEQCKSAAK